jgi:hypothetical protein
MHDFVGPKRPEEQSHIKVPFVTTDGDFKEAFVKVQKYNTDDAGRMSQRLAESIVGFCSGCRMQSTLTFPNGADHKDCDRVIQGKAMKTFCPRCQKITEFLPAATYFNHPLVQRNQEHVRGGMGLTKEDFR